MIHDDEFSVHVVGAQLWDPKRDNIDIEVRFADGRRYGATFFTIENLSRLFQKNRATGECAGGIYLWAANMIIVQDLSMETVARTIHDLLEREEFERSFCALRELD
jgi:hypothetical protein